MEHVHDAHPDGQVGAPRSPHLSRGRPVRLGHGRAASTTGNRRRFGRSETCHISIILFTYTGYVYI